ncbi:tryptophan-rich sensory protein [Larkinella soli]|uniref:tryptophan-rich sensory protein n=1 Tax=Larkinella soli TaxID=1770527 RepID=UPI000FFB398C|nr:tryptophan-rich sensory protein [Larkinella soli]
MKNRMLEQYATAAVVIGSIIGTYFFSRPRQSGFRTRLDREQQTELDRNLLTPANATFGLVWPVIYSGTVGLAVHQALPSQTDNPRYAQARPLLWVNSALNALFGYFFSKSDRDSRTGAALTTIALLPVSLGLHRNLEIGRQAVPEPEKTLRRSISLYAGWLTAASVVSVGNLLLQAGYRVSPESATRWAFGVLSATAGLGIAVSKRLDDPYYLTTLIAAFAGIAAKQTGRNDDLARVAAGLALLLTGVLADALRRKKPEQPAETAPEAAEPALPVPA